MSKHVSKHCSILNYIRLKNEQLYTLIEELCLGRIFVPKKGGDGITFLMPSDEMIEEFYKLDEKGDTEIVAEHIRALVLRHHINDVNGFRISNGEVISTISKKALPIEKVDGKTVHLEGGQKITLDSEFKARADRAAKIAVYHINGNLIDLKNLQSAPDNAKKPVRGGADYDKNRKDLFNNVLRQHCANQGTRDVALEVLVSLIKYLTKNRHEDVLDTVTSQLSNDTLTTLAIVLQPYKLSNHYIPDDILTAWTTAYSSNKTELFSYIKNPVKFYQNAMTVASAKYSKTIAEIKEKHAKFDMSSVAKDNIVATLQDMYKDIDRYGLPAARKRVLQNPSEAIAEAELRVMGFILHDPATGVDFNEASTTFQNCTLNTPYLCGQYSIKIMSTSAFYSSAFLIIRCEAMIYLPGYAAGWDNINQSIANSNKMLSIDVSLPLRTELDDNYNKTLENLLAQLQDYQ